MKKNPIRVVWLILGLCCFGLGTIGIILPILPTVPLYMATVVCFSNSSQRLHDWFLGTNMYKKHLESFVHQRMMTKKTKLSIVWAVTVVMGFGFFMMENVPIGRSCLVIVWLCHMLYFFFRVKTISQEDLQNLDTKIGRREI